MSYIIPELCPPRAPKLDRSNLTGRDLQIGESAQANLEALEETCYTITSSIDLYHQCVKKIDALLAAGPEKDHRITQSVFWHGARINARSCALCLRDYRHALHSVRTLPGSIAQWQGRFDGATLKLLENRYTDRFPNIDNVRHAAAHPEYYSNPNKNNTVFEIHEPGIDLVSQIPIMIRNSQFGDFYTATFDGKVVGFDISGATNRFVVEITQLAFDAFRDLDTSPNEPPC